MPMRLVKAMTKAVISPLIDSTGFYDRRLRRASSISGAWSIVMYHRVIDDARADPFGLGMCVSRDRFEDQIRYLRARFNILTVGDAVGRLRNGDPLPERALSITFDDGYRDNLTLALPVMQALEVPFSVYVPSEGLDDDQPLWWDRVIASLACTAKTEIDLAEVGLASSTERLTLRSFNDSAHAELILNRLWGLGKVECERSVMLIERTLQARVMAPLLASRLRPLDIVELHLQGVEIGAHSASHPNLALAKPALIRSELSESRLVLESLLQVPVQGLAYPGGRVGENAQAIAAELGYAYALGTDTGLNLPSYELMRLRRIGMPSTDLPDVRRAVGLAMAKMGSNERLRF